MKFKPTPQSVLIFLAGLAVVAAVTLLPSCSTVEVSPSPTGNPSGKPSETHEDSPGRCKVVPTTLHRVRGGNRWKDDLVLPFTGRMVEESHLRTRDDTQSVSCPSGGIDAHIARNCDAVKKADPTGDWTTCSLIYGKGYDHRKQWTPPEPDCAAGSIERDAISAEAETWVVNFMANLPREKWLISGPKGYVVVATGLEVGPGDQSWLGGAQPAPHYFAGTSNEVKMTVHGRLADQSVPYGPVRCE
jgi:hypothetical protein